MASDLFFFERNPMDCESILVPLIGFGIGVFVGIALMELDDIFSGKSTNL